MLPDAFIASLFRLDIDVITKAESTAESQLTSRVPPHSPPPQAHGGSNRKKNQRQRQRRQERQRREKEMLKKEGLME